MTTQLQIEPGKFYKTRDGRKARIYATNGGYNYHVHGAVLMDGEWGIATWKENGSFWEVTGGYTDIVSLWQEPLDFDPSCLPAWANKWIAMDCKGNWCAYNDKPALMNTTGLWSVLGIWDIIPPDFAPKNYTGDWKDSLFGVEKLNKLHDMGNDYPEW